MACPQGRGELGRVGAAEQDQRLHACIGTEASAALPTSAAAAAARGQGRVRRKAQIGGLTLLATNTYYYHVDQAADVGCLGGTRWMAQIDGRWG